MVALIGSFLMGAVAVLYLLAAVGLPLGDFLMGGCHKILPARLRAASGILCFVQCFAVFVLLRTGGVISVGMPFAVSRGFCFFFAVYLTLNVLFNLCSKGRRERLIMTPVSIFAASCFWITALGA